MTDMFAAAVAIVLPEEGPYALDAGDPGGETKWGIARNAHPEISAEDWAAFTRDDAIDLYRAQYWTAHDCDAMPWRWALAVFDGAINQGDAAVKLAQEALGVPEDGNIGKQTLDAIAKAGDEQFEMFLALRARAYAFNGGEFIRFGKGWLKRLFNVALHTTAPA